jgi:alkylation response protein AidB-like acyl-CoA dehydrogenase
MELSATQEAIRETVREFADEEIRPVAAEADQESAFPEAVWDGLADLDLTGLTVPETYGGFDADRLTCAVVNEEVASGSLAVATALSVHCLASSSIADFGDESVRDEWLPEMGDGRPVGAFALSEPDAGSNPAEMSTVAREAADGDGYVIDGKKQWITNGERAGVVVVFAKADPRPELGDAVPRPDGHRRTRSRQEGVETRATGERHDQSRLRWSPGPRALSTH